MNANKAIPNVIIFVSFIMFLCRFIILENGRGFFSSMAQISRKWSFEMGALLWTFTPWLLVHVVVCEITIFVQDYSFLKNGLLLTAEEMTSTIETIYFSLVVHVFTLCIRETEGSETNRSSENWYCCKLWMFIRHYLKFVIIFFFKWDTSWWTLHWYCTYLLFCPLPSWCFWQARRGSECEAACSLSQSQVIGSRSYNHPLYCLWLRVLTVARAGLLGKLSHHT